MKIKTKINLGGRFQDFEFEGNSAELGEFLESCKKLKEGINILMS